MSSSIERLISLLHQTHGLYERLLPILEQEREAALAPDMDRLMGATADKESILTRLQDLERQRTRLVHELTRELGLSNENASLERMAEHLGGPDASRLREVHQSLNCVLADIRRANARSRLVMSHCLSLVQNSLAFLTHWMRPAAVYGATGHLDARTAGGRLLSGSI